MPRPFSAEFCLRAVGLVRASKTMIDTELGINTGALHRWVRQNQVYRGEQPGLTTYEPAELAKSKKRIRASKAEVETLKRAAKLLGEDCYGPKGLIEVIDQLVDAGRPVKVFAGCSG